MPVSESTYEPSHALPTRRMADAATVHEATIARRRLVTSLVHGSGRTWLDSRRLWPGLAIGLVIVALVVAGTGVRWAYRQQQKVNQQENHQSGLVVTPTASPSH